MSANIAATIQQKIASEEEKDVTIAGLTRVILMNF